MSLLINTKQAAELLFGEDNQTTRKRVSRFAAANNVKIIKDGRSVWYRREDIENITSPKTKAPGVAVGSKGLRLGN